MIMVRDEISGGPSPLGQHALLLDLDHSRPTSVHVSLGLPSGTETDTAVFSLSSTTLIRRWRLCLSHLRVPEGGRLPLVGLYLANVDRVGYSSHA